jgi:WD40 repeat protein
MLVSGAVDCSARVWDVARAREVAKLEGHTQYVQGVAWDPTGALIATQSNDRTIRVFSTPVAAAIQQQAA